MASSFLRSSNVVVIVVVVLVVVAAIVLMVCQEKWVSPVQRGRRSVETFVSNPCNANKPNVSVSYEHTTKTWQFTNSNNQLQTVNDVWKTIHDFSKHCNMCYVGLPLNSSVSETTKIPTDSNALLLHSCTDTDNAYWMFPITESKQYIIQKELKNLLLQTSHYQTGRTSLKFYCGDSPTQCGDGSYVISSGTDPCASATPYQCGKGEYTNCKHNPNANGENLLINKCECNCPKFNGDMTNCLSCRNCSFNNNNLCTATNEGNYYPTPPPPPAQTTVTLGGPFSPNPLNQDLSEPSYTSPTTVTPSTSLTPTYPSYSPPSQQPQQMTTPAAARDYYNYGYSNGYSSGYYASLYSRYPYYGYSNGYNNGYSNNNSYYGYYGGYAQGSGTPVASQESL